MTTSQILALAVLLLVFALGSVRNIHVGALALLAALGVGLTLGAESVSQIMAGFPVDLMLLLLGITFLLEIARSNGTLDRLVGAAVRRTGDRKALLPWVMFGIALLIAALGNPLASMIVIPIALALAKENGLDPVVMGLGAINGSLVGCFAPTSLYGILTVGVAELGGVELNPWLQFGFVFVAITVLQALAQYIFGRHHHVDTGGGEGTGLPSSGNTGATGSSTVLAPPQRELAPATTAQRMTILSLIVMLLLVIGIPLAGYSMNVGVIALALAVFLSLLYPEETRSAIGGIDWPTILLVGGIVTYVAFLKRQGTIDGLGEVASSIPWPLLAVFTLCIVGALISAFASTTALLPVIIPLSLPLVMEGNISGVGLIIALGFSATLVDSMPFSTSGAVMVASAEDEDRRRVTSSLMKWGGSMIVVGPVISCLFLVLPSAL